MKSFRNLLESMFGRKSKEPYRTIIFYSCFISFTICLSLFLNIFTFSRNFFENNTILVFTTLFTSTVVTSSDSFNVIIRTGFQMVVSCFIGDIIAYISVVIFVDKLWITIFIYLVFLFFTSGYLLSSKTLPWAISKRMYFEYFLLVFVIKPTNRSPIIFLKSALASIFTLIFVLIGCFIMNPFFSSQLYLRTAARNIHRSHQSTKLLGRQLEIKTISELKSPLQRKSHKKILYNIHSRLLQSKSNLPLFSNNTFKSSNNRDNYKNTLPSTNNELKIKKNIQLYLNKFQYLKSPDNSNSNNNNSKSNRNSNNNNNGNGNGNSKSNSNNNYHFDINLNTLHATPTTLRKKRDIIINNSDEIINNYKNQLTELNIKYALDLNRLERYFEESKMEFWNQNLVGNFKEISEHLEKIYNIINSMQVLIVKHLSTKRCKLLLPLVPHINSIIHLSNNISIIMENQILGNYRVNKVRGKVDSILNRIFNSNNNSLKYNSNQYSNDNNNSFNLDNSSSNNSSNSDSFCDIKMNEKEIYKKTLKYSQDRIIKYFQRIDILVQQLTNEYYQVEVTKDLLEFDQESQCELSRIHFFLNLLSSFIISQKKLSNIIVSSTKCLYRHNQIYHIEMFILIGYWVINLPSNILAKLKSRKNRQKIPRPSSVEILEPVYSKKEKLKLFTKSILSRVLFKWKFSLKFSLFISIITISYYQITIHSNFVLFRALTWYIIPILYVSAPSIGASGFSCFMRFFGTLFGVFSAYTVGVLFSLTNHEGTKALCYVALTFVIMAFINYITRGRHIQSFGNFFILAYATITFPEFTQNRALILNTLLRWFDISLAVFTIMALSYILPYYDHKELELNLLDIIAKELKSFKKIINYHFDSNIIEMNNSYNSNNNETQSICQHINSIPDYISTCSSFYSSDYNYIKSLHSSPQPVPLPSISSIEKSAFQNILWPMFHNIRSKITQQRVLLFNSKFELLFQKNKFIHLQELLNLISTQYKILVSLEYIILSNNFNDNKYDSYFFDQIRLTIIPKLKYILSELDYSSESFIEIRNSKLDNFNNRPVVFPTTNLKILMEEVYCDYHSLVFCNCCDIEHSFSIHQLGCLLYTFDLFIENNQKICNHVWFLSNAIKVERGDLISNFNSSNLDLENLNYNSINDNDRGTSIIINGNNSKQKRNKSYFNNNSNYNSNSSTTHSSSSIGSCISSRSLNSSLSSSSGSSSLQFSDDIDMFIPYTRGSIVETNEQNISTNNKI